MPLLRIQTTRALNQAGRSELLARAPSTTARLLGKPERYMMVSLETGCGMVFAGSDAPLAYLELKSIGLPADQTATLSAALCKMIQDTLGIDPDRVYIEFADVPRHRWGWGGATFQR